MPNKYPLLPLSEAITQRKDIVTIKDSEQYKRCRVQLHARGVVLRDIMLGADIKTKKQQVCRGGQLLVAEIDAKVGGFGIVPKELDGAIVSSHYFLFDINESKLKTTFLEYYIKTPEFMNQVVAQGSTNYAAIRPAHVLGYLVPMPDRDIQTDIVNKLKSMDVLLQEARAISVKMVEEVNALSVAVLKKAFN